MINFGSTLKIKRYTYYLVIVLTLVIIGSFNSTAILGAQHLKGNAPEPRWGLSGNASVWYNATHGATYHFSGYIPLEWNTSTPILIEYQSSFHCVDGFQKSSYQLYLHVELYNQSETLVYRGKTLLETVPEDNWEFLDTFRHIKLWNLTETVTNIPQNAMWRGVAYFNGSVRLNTTTNWDISRKGEIFYRNLPSLDSKFFVFLISSLGVLSGGGVIALIYYYKRSKRP